MSGLQTRKKKWPVMIRTHRHLSAFASKLFVFDDDKFVDADYRSRQQLRGGSGILHLKKENGKWIGRRDIVLGP